MAYVLNVCLQKHQLWPLTAVFLSALFVNPFQHKKFQIREQDDCKLSLLRGRDLNSDVTKQWHVFCWGLNYSFCFELILT